MLSVIIPAFNRWPFLEKTLITLFQQECSSQFEVIVIDTGDDSTEEMISRQFPVVQYYKRSMSSNRSLIRNLGAEMALGETLVFIDNDMLVPEGYLEAHLEAHKKSGNRVVLAKRRALIDLSWKGVRVDRFVDDLNLMRKIPWFIDPRDKQLMKRVPEHEGFHDDWFICYSHGFSVSKELFEISGGFDPDFGDKWGLEDVELGYRLGLQGAHFEVLENVDAYHQYHGSQYERNKAQMLDNWKIFLEKHLSPEIEVVKRFSQVFGPIHRLRKTRNAFPSDYASRQYTEDLVLGCFWTIRENRPGDKYHLGLCMDYEKERYESVRIVKDFFLYDKIIQLEILYNALKVSDEVILEKKDQDSYSLFCELLILLSAEVDVQDNIEYYTIHLKKMGKPRLIQIILPNISQPRQRFFFLRFALWLEEEANYFVGLVDSNNKEGFDFEQFQFSAKQIETLNSMQYRKLEFAEVTVLISEDETDTMEQEEMIFPSKTIIIKDFGFPLVSDKLMSIDLHKGDDLSVVYEKEYTTLLAHSSGLDMADSSFRPREKELSKDAVLLFINNDYITDQIEVSLKAFSEIFREYKKLKLFIVVNDFEKTASHSHLIGNDVLKKMTLNEDFREHSLSLARVHHLIDSLNLANKVEILDTCLSLEERSALYHSACALVSISLDVLPGPEVFEAIWSGCPVVLGEHKVLGLDHLAEGRVFKVPSCETDLSEAMKIPYTSETALYKAWTCSSTDLIAALKQAIEQHTLLKDSELPVPDFSALNRFTEEYLT